MQTHRPCLRPAISGLSLPVLLLGFLGACSPPGDSGPGQCPSRPQQPLAAPQLSLYATSRYLYADVDGDPATQPIQSLQAPDLVNPSLVAVLSGEIYDDQGQPLSCVRISTVLSDLGPTSTWSQTAPSRSQPVTDGAARRRPAGLYDLVVNGGQTVALKFELDGYLPVIRTLAVVADRNNSVDPIVMLRTPAAEGASTVSLGSADVQIVSSPPRGGWPRDYLFILPNTQACLANVEDAETPYDQTAPCPAVDSFQLNVMEIGVSNNSTIADIPHAAALPRELPVDSSAGFMHTVKYYYSVPAAAAAGSTLKFSQPVIAYTEYFNESAPQGQGLLPNSVIPSAFFSDGLPSWHPTDNGVVMTLAAMTDGTYQIQPPQVDADLTPDERRKLIDTFRERIGMPGQVLSLWRTKLNHFTHVDNSRKLAPPEGAVGPPESLDASTTDVTTRTVCSPGVLPSQFKLKCDPQAFIYEVDPGGYLPGDFQLVMNSTLMPGFLSGAEVSVQVVKPDYVFPPQLAPFFQEARVTVAVNNLRATRVLQRIDLEALADTKAATGRWVPGHWTFPGLWNELASYGPLTTGVMPASVEVTYLWKGLYYTTDDDEAQAWGKYAGWQHVTDLESLDLVGLRSTAPVTLQFMSSGLTRYPVFSPFLGLGLTNYHGFLRDAKLVVKGDGTVMNPTSYLPLATAAFIPQKPIDDHQLSVPARVYFSDHTNELYVADSGLCQVLAFDSMGVLQAAETIGQTVKAQQVCSYSATNNWWGTPSAIAHDGDELLIATQDGPDHSKILVRQPNKPVQEFLGIPQTDIPVPTGPTPNINIPLLRVVELVSVDKGLVNPGNHGIYYVEQDDTTQQRRLRYVEYPQLNSGMMNMVQVNFQEILPASANYLPQGLAAIVEWDGRTLQYIHRLYFSNSDGSIQLMTIRPGGLVSTPLALNPHSRAAGAIAVPNSPLAADGQRLLYYADATDPSHLTLQQLRFTIDGYDVPSLNSVTLVAGSPSAPTDTSCATQVHAMPGPLLAENIGLTAPLAMTVTSGGDLYVVDHYGTNPLFPQIFRLEHTTAALVTSACAMYDCILDTVTPGERRTLFAFSRDPMHLGRHEQTWREQKYLQGDFQKLYTFQHESPGPGMAEELAEILIYGTDPMVPSDQITISSTHCNPGSLRCIIHNGRSMDLAMSETEDLIGKVSYSGQADGLSFQYTRSPDSGQVLLSGLSAPDSDYTLIYDAGGRLTSCTAKAKATSGVTTVTLQPKPPGVL